MFDIAIIGAGIIGTMISRELSKYKLDIILLEKDNDVANGATKANSAIIHAGYDALPNTIKAKTNAEGNAMFDQLCVDLSVPFSRIGSLVVAKCEEEKKVLTELYERGKKNGVPNLKILEKEEVLQMEPSLTNKVAGALFAPSAGIIGPWELAIALAENAIENGVELKLNYEVKNITKEKDYYKIYCDEDYLEAKYVINCAGIYADKINNMINSPYFEIMPDTGEYQLYDKSVGKLFNSIIFQCPTDKGKGVLALSTVHGNFMIGPTSERVKSKENKGTTRRGKDFLKENIRDLCEEFPYSKIITAFTGLRAKVISEDFIIEETGNSSGFINVAGIDSPGLSASPAIAKMVVNILNNIASLEKKEKFNEKRKAITQFITLSDDEKSELIKKDKRYGKIICRCENITEGEIVDSIKRSVGATTVDGVKRRARPGSGRCQGGFCSPRVMEILTRELNVGMYEILKSNKGSYNLIKRKVENENWSGENV
ncbi:MAG: NAD(P)/FAD-dependent oxidoreductase [Clostridiales bacterium]|nr:NAD(P)/FAD-dependent oxidoreductase [Clostridiales bacterium]